MYLSSDKLMHFVVGVAVGVGFWRLLEHHAKAGVRRINPIWFLVMLIWGASGLFFFRKLNFPVLSHDFFYMAVPDWDVPLYNWTRLRFLIHRSWLFHSVLLPIGLLVVSLWAVNRNQIAANIPIWKWLRDAAMGLLIGISAHLLWDALLSETKAGFMINGWNHSASLAWLVFNLILGFGVPFGVVWAMDFIPGHGD